jgi:hypothetical protein
LMDRRFDLRRAGIGQWRFSTDMKLTVLVFYFFSL